MKRKVYKEKFCRHIVCAIAIICCSCATINNGVVMQNSEQSAQTYKILPIEEKGRFGNPFPPDPPTGETPFSSMFRRHNTTRRPKNFLPSGEVDIARALPENEDGIEDGVFVTWLGHSSVLMQIDGARILIDPVFSNNASPVFFFRVRRFQEHAPIRAEDLPQLDAVFISHNHYDHLDSRSIKALADKVNYFFVPVGIGNHLRKWGVDTSKIREMTWWDEGSFVAANGFEFKFACTPARHFSGRSPFNLSRSLWVSWVFIGNERRVFYSGDTSYGFHFKQIGYHYGPFDLTLMENGQYYIGWTHSHLFPAQTVLAHKELRGNFLMPVHWGTFNLAPHNWWDPPEELLAAATGEEFPILLPRIGQTIKIGEDFENDFWWREFMPE